uniref:Uncharacterized protein n=1 Tax=Magallana gigas TaxID=29159 RepID=K1S687_MAGGI
MTPETYQNMNEKDIFPESFLCENHHERNVYFVKSCFVIVGRPQMADGSLNELNADFDKDGKVETKVTLSKTRAQQDGPLKGQKFSKHSSIIIEKSSITPTCVSVRLPLNGELFGYDVEIPDADFDKDGKVETKVTLSKTRAQQDGPLKGQKFSKHSSIIIEKSSITPTCVSVRLPLNGELFGYDVEIPDGHQIDPKKTVITPKNDVIEIKIVKIDYTGWT